MFLMIATSSFLAALKCYSEVDGASGVAREVRGCGPHRAALARDGKRAKIVLKNSRENSDCVCVR